MSWFLDLTSSSAETGCARAAARRSSSSSFSPSSGFWPALEDGEEEEHAGVLQEHGLAAGLRGPSASRRPSAVEPRALAGGEDVARHLQGVGVGMARLRHVVGDDHRRAAACCGGSRPCRRSAVWAGSWRDLARDRLALRGWGRSTSRSTASPGPGRSRRRPPAWRCSARSRCCGSRARPGCVRGVEVRHAADREDAVGVGGVGLVEHHLEEPAEGRVFDPQPALLLDHVALGLEVLLRDVERAHAVGLHPQDPLQVVAGEGLEVEGAVEVGGGVVAAADRGDEVLVLLGAEVRRALEHDVLEEVGEAAAPLPLVLRADVVPDLDGRPPAPSGLRSSSTSRPLASLCSRTSSLGGVTLRASAAIAGAAAASEGRTRRDARSWLSAFRISFACWGIGID